MKNNKGFIGIGIIVAIVAAFAVAGGFIYYFARTSTPAPQNPAGNTYWPPANQNTATNPPAQNLPTQAPQQPEQASNCSSTSTPSIQVLSPNGGENYTTGQQINVKWSSCNLPTTWVVVSLQKDGGQDTLLTNPETSDDGSEIFTLPLNTSSGNYKIRVGHASSRVQQDLSDNYFLIQ